MSIFSYSKELDFSIIKAYDLIEFKCENCGEVIQIQKRKFTKPFCRKCKLQEKRMNGSYDNAAQKTKETCLEKYGTETVFQSQHFKDKLKENNIEKYGVENYFESDDFKKKRENTIIEKHGSLDNYYKYQNKKSEETFKKNHAESKGEFLAGKVKEKYGCNAQQVDSIREKTKSTCLEKYGTNSPLGNDTINKKAHETFKKRYGVTSTLAFKSTREKTMKTMLEKYGVESPGLSPEIMKKAHGKYSLGNEVFDSSWELAYYVWLKDNHTNFEYHPNVKLEFELNGKKHICLPDFRVENKLIEIKGGQFIDKTGNWKNPYEQSLNELYEAKHQCLVNNQVEIITDCSEQLQYVKNKYGNDFVKNCKNSKIEELAEYWSSQPFPFYDKENNMSYSTAIRYFHKSIWEAHKDKLLAPIEIWKNKDMMKCIIKNRFKYIGILNEETLRRGICVYYKAKVSVFKPSLAIRLIKKYLNDVSEIFDPFSGFSGRMLGAYDCNKKYIGQDLNEKHVQESNEIIKYYNIKSASVTVKDILQDSCKEYESLFTCSPYSTKEHWNENEEDKSCDEWIDICLEKYKCKKYLFVVDKTEKYKDFIVDEISNKDMYGDSKEYVVLLNK